MSVDLRPSPGRDRNIGPLRGRRRRGVRLPEFSTRWVVVGALVAVALRLPYVRTPLRSDEGGFLLVASQWHPGSSLYGNYWVDRPPLLIAFYGVADRLGGATALRLMGCVLVFTAVLLAHLLGRTMTRSVVRRVSAWPAVLTFALVVIPWGGALEVNGELVALPLVLLGLIAAVRAANELEGDRRWRMWAAAGALGAAAAMVKQNFFDVLVFGTVLIVMNAWSAQPAPKGPRPRRAAAAQLGALGAGAAVAGAAVVVGAWTRGTTPAGLWDALVMFRLDASKVIADSAREATDIRLRDLLLAMCLSGTVALVLVYAVHVARRWRQPLVAATAALLAWELFAVLASGSYWLHYLVGLVPGLVLAVALVATRSGMVGLVARMAVSYAAAAAVITAPLALVTSPPSYAVPAASAWLRVHTRPGDTATILYGSPHLLQAAGLSSPYPQLWSLPVRVRDPHLVQLESVLRGPDAPTWLLARNDLATWGVASATADVIVDHHYEAVTVVDGYTVYHLQHTGRSRQEPS